MLYVSRKQRAKKVEIRMEYYLIEPINGLNFLLKHVRKIINLSLSTISLMNMVL